MERGNNDKPTNQPTNDLTTEALIEDLLKPSVADEPGAPMSEVVQCTDAELCSMFDAIRRDV
jgi:hypothetical protein